ncbi:MAG: glycoside hydrolase family 97 N-terminal domain-containing protein, partial [Gemmataceae bacterium]
MIVWRFALISILGMTFSKAHAADPLRATAPDGRAAIEVELAPPANVPQFRVLWNGTEVLAPSPLGFLFEDGTSIGGPCELVSQLRRPVREAFTQVSGKRRNVRWDAEELILTLREKAAPGRTWELQLRAANDGVAFRYRVPEQSGWPTLAIQSERTAFRPAATATAFALPLNSFTTSYEKRYERRAVGTLPREWLLGLPLLLKPSAGPWLAITEANVAEFAGLYLAPGAGGTLEARLSPPEKSNAERLPVRHALPHSSPWRVVLLGETPGHLIESDLVLALNEPCAIADPSWIRPGKTTFPWWNGFHEEN